MQIEVNMLDFGLEEIFSGLNIALALVLLWSVVYSQKRFGVVVYKKPWRLFTCVAVLMMVGSVLRLSISLYGIYPALWIPRALDATERVLLIIGIYMLASVAADLWKS